MLKTDSAGSMIERLEDGLGLSDSFRAWGVAMGRKPAPDHTSTVLDWARLSAAGNIEYAVVGGVALWAYVAEEQQRTTKDLDIVVSGSPEGIIARLPDGWRETCSSRRDGDSIELRHAPEGTPVHLISEPSTGIAGIVERATTLPVLGASLRVADARDLIRAKLRAAGSAARVRRYRQDLQDIVDIFAARPELSADSIPSLSPKQARLLRELQRDARRPSD